ncbi:hypothetical protein ACET3Z_031864 [Daucus carota]
MYSDSAEYPAAVAAAVYAITIRDSSMDTQDRDDPASRILTTIRRRSEGTNVNIQENVVATVPSSGRSPTANKRFNSIAAVESENSEPKKTGVSNLWINKNQTFADKNVYNSGTGNLDSTFLRTEYQSAETDAWEKAEMAKITERYEVLNETILQWESKEKTAAKRKLDKKESELEKKRAKAMQHYRTKVAMIDQIAGGARTKAEENRRQEEVQVKEKAYKIRTTGKYPSSCFCF